MQKQRIKQLGASFLIVLSLFVSSISAACTCSHESKIGEHCQNSTETKNDEHAAHEHSRETSGANVHHQHEEKTNSSQFASMTESNCCCVVQLAPRAVAKAENVKIEKHPAAILPATPLEFALNHQPISIKSGEFFKAFYLSDSFHNLAPGRAPPRL